MAPKGCHERPGAGISVVPMGRRWGKVHDPLGQPGQAPQAGRPIEIALQGRYPQCPQCRDLRRITNEHPCARPMGRRGHQQTGKPGTHIPAAHNEHSGTTESGRKGWPHGIQAEHGRG